MLSHLYTPVERLKLTELTHNLVTPVKPMGIDPLSVGLTGEAKNISLSSLFYAKSNKLKKTTKLKLMDLHRRLYPSKYLG